MNVTWPTQKKPRRLRLTPTVWAQLVTWRDAGPTEIAAFGVTAAADPLLVTELHLVKQTASRTHVAFDDEAIADYFDAQVDRGRSPSEFGRVWLHTHPGESALPSEIDELTFARAFGAVEGAIMAIVARGGQVYARRKSGEIVEPLTMVVDFRAPFDAADHAAWLAEFHERVTPIAAHPSLSERSLDRDTWFNTPRSCFMEDAPWYW